MGWRPAAIASYSAGRFSGVRSGAAWHGILSEMGMVVIAAPLPSAGLAKLSTQRATSREPAARL